MYNEIPIDWLMAHFLRIKVPPRSGRIIIPMASLFLPIGWTSSLALNGVRGNRSLERIFGQYDQKYKGLNRPATVTSSLSASQGKPHDAYDKGGRNCPPANHTTTKQHSLFLAKREVYFYNRIHEKRQHQDRNKPLCHKTPAKNKLW